MCRCASHSRLGVEIIQVTPHSIRFRGAVLGVVEVEGLAPDMASPGALAEAW